MLLYAVGLIAVSRCRHRSDGAASQASGRKATLAQFCGRIPAMDPEATSVVAAAVSLQAVCHCMTIKRSARKC